MSYRSGANEEAAGGVGDLATASVLSFTSSNASSSASSPRSADEKSSHSATPHAASSATHARHPFLLHLYSGVGLRNDTWELGLARAESSAGSKRGRPSKGSAGSADGARSASPSPESSPGPTLDHSAVSAEPLPVIELVSER